MKTLKVVAVLMVLLCVWGVSGVFAQSETGRPFITKWQGEKGKELKIPIVGTYKMVIKDGSGNEKINKTVTVADADHPYVFTPTKDGTYTVAAGPEGVKSMQMKAEWEDDNWILLTSNDKLLEVLQFGTVKWESMKEMFKVCENMIFAAGIDTPDLSNVTDMQFMFSDCSSFNQSLNDWKVNNVTDMRWMFYGCSSFNQPLNNWNVSKVTNMAAMFDGCTSFNQPLNNWNVSKVTEMRFMFAGCTSFNQPIDNWKVDNVDNMSWMFSGCTSFNQPLNNWNVSNVTEMSSMFSDCTFFNQPLNSWNVSKVTEMSWMFHRCTSFNQPLNEWNVSNVTGMIAMFEGCSSFNQPLGNWNVSNVTDMTRMFEGCTSFNQQLGLWKIKTYIGGLSTTAMSPSNYSQTLVGWAGQTNIAGNLDFEEDVKDLIYNDEGKEARQKLIDKGWNFEGDTHQSSGVSITPHFFPLALNKECTLPLEKWGVVDTEEVTLSTDTDGIISYALTADKKGVHIKGLKEGRCELTATIAVKPGMYEQTYTSTCEIEVYIPIERITITPASKTLKVGEEFTFTVNIFPENATEREVEWSSGNSKIVTVDNNGKVTTQKAGKCTVYVNIKEYGREFHGICEVTVEEASDGGNTVSSKSKGTPQKAR